MKSKLVLLALLLSFFSCKEKKETTPTTIVETEEVETNETPSNTPKFEDVNGCRQYATLYNALPHLDSYKEMEFRGLECISEKQSDTASWSSLNVSYYDPKTENKIEINFYEINGDVTEERDVIRMARASYTGLTKLPNYYKSGLTIFENASVEIMSSNSDDNYSTANYMGTYKDKYAILIKIEMLGKIDLEKVDSFIKEYLLAIMANSLL